jgi:hypothetical protein
MTLRARDRRTRQLIRYIRDKAELLRAYDPRRTGIRSHSVAALALGAVAIGALAIGALAIGKLAIGRARIKRLEIDELLVRQLYVTDELHVPPNPDPE